VTELRFRQAVRALLVTPDEFVLLVRFEFPTRTVWALPGGGLEPGEDHLTALRRELVEEVGLNDITIGPHVWNREHIVAFEDGLWDGQQDRIHLVATAHFEPEPALSWDQLRAERLHEIRWWSVDEIERAQDVAFAPQRLAELLRLLANDGIPGTPLDTGR
jgi:8-oxo-dGTP diphosphatase